MARAFRDRIHALLHDWQEIAWAVPLIVLGLLGAYVSDAMGERAGIAPWSYLAQLWLISAAVAGVSLLAWLVKRALIGDLPTEECERLARDAADPNRPADYRADCRRLLLLDGLASLACAALVVAVIAVLY